MKKLIVANWKMNPVNREKARKLLNSLKKRLTNIKKAEIVICPPFVYLPILAEGSFFKTFKLGAQDCFWKTEGPFTGEVSPGMLKDLRVSYVIVGHSERRKTLSETDEMISEKVSGVLKAGLYPLLCVGETKKEREKGRTFEVLRRQIKIGLKKVKKTEIKKVVIAYEPVWAIGTGEHCRVKEATEAVLFFKKTIISLFGRRARDVKVLYGGSVNSKNSSDYLKEPWIDGLLLGRASLDALEFAKILKNVSITN
jgi:triosephosphate isomerase